MKTGFSLIELLIVLTIISLLSVSSYIGLSTLSAQRSLDHSYHTLYASLTHAQSLSQNTGYTAIICPSANSKQCSQAVDWPLGWLSFQDYNDNLALDADDKIANVRQIENNKIQIKFSGLNRGQKIIFRTNGRLWPNGNFVICHQALDYFYKITTLASGRIRTEKINHSNCE